MDLVERLTAATQQFHQAVTRLGFVQQNNAQLMMAMQSWMEHQQFHVYGMSDYDASGDGDSNDSGGGGGSSWC